VVIGDYLKRAVLDMKPDHEVDDLAMATSWVASTRGVALLPAYSQNFLPWSVISHPLAGEVPAIDLVIGYHKANTSLVLGLFLLRIDRLIANVSSQTR
jgi:LysR family hca operon transcriptional activator